jgi:ComF family protein
VHLLATAVDRVLDLAFPAICPGCRAEGDAICARCLEGFAPHLARPPGVPIGMPGDVPAPLVQLEWVAPYGTLLRRAIHALKYGGEQRLARPLGRLVADRWRRAGRGGQLLVPVPIHGDRRRERGYDQAELVARVTGRALGLPVVAALDRQRATARQFALDRTERRGNVEGAFAVPAIHRAAVADRWIVLVDDVVTTGATLAACATALRASGALAVSAVAVARER